MVVMMMVACGYVQAAEPAKTDATKAPTTTSTDKWVKHYYDRVAQFREGNAVLKAKGGKSAEKNIVMVGTSQTEGFNAEKLLPGRRVVNRGVSSDSIGLGPRGALHRMDESVFDCNPGVIVLENGINDIGMLARGGKPTIDQIEAGYRKMIDTIRERLPDTPLVIVGLFPTRDRYALLVPHVVEFNKRLAKLAKEYKSPFVETYSSMADAEGLLRKDLTRDGLHLNDTGYAIWADLLEKALPPKTALPTSRPSK